MHAWQMYRQNESCQTKELHQTHLHELLTCIAAQQLLYSMGPAAGQLV
jgi:hypothetical protein